MKRVRRLLRFVDHHLAATGIALATLSAAMMAATWLAPARPEGVPLFGSHELAASFTLLVALLGLAGALLFLIGVTRSHDDRV